MTVSGFVIYDRFSRSELSLLESKTPLATFCEIFLTFPSSKVNLARL